MEYHRAKKLAKELLTTLAPFCDKIDIVGDIAQKKNKVDQIDIVAIPKFYDSGMFKTGIATILHELEYIEGMLPNFKAVRKINDEINLYFYSCDHYNYGYITAWANSPEPYRKSIKANWTSKGYKSNENRHLTTKGSPVKIPDERSFFQRIGMPFIEPEMR